MSHIWFCVVLELSSRQTYDIIQSYGVSCVSSSLKSRTYSTETRNFMNCGIISRNETESTNNSNRISAASANNDLRNSEAQEKKALRDIIKFTEDIFTNLSSEHKLTRDRSTQRKCQGESNTQVRKVTNSYASKGVKPRLWMRRKENMSNIGMSVIKI